MTESEFTARHGVRESSQLLLGLTGPSGGGKTLSALRLAQGITSVMLGKIFIIDTDGGKCLEYAPAEGEQADPAKFTFDFEYVELGPPYSSLRYRDAIVYCASKNASVIIVDQMSHEHDGEGGYLAFGEEEVKRVGKAYGANWRAPKTDRKLLIQSFARSKANIIFCFRAEEKLDWKEKAKANEGQKKGEPRPLGWMPIAGQMFFYELNAGLVLQPAAEGTFVADRNTLTADQKMVFKVREYFKKMLSKEAQIDESLGRKMALWATGGKILSAEQAERRQERIGETATRTAQSVSSSGPQVPTGPDHSEPCPLCKNNPPRCSMCEIELIWRGAETHPRWGARPGRWGCPRKCTPQKTTIKGTDWHAILEGDAKLKEEREGALFQAEPGASG